MALQVIEHVTSDAESIGLNDGSNEKLYHVMRTLSGLDVRTAIQAEAPLTYHGLQRGTIDIAHVGGGIWTAKVKYGNLDLIEMDLELGGEKIKIHTSKQTIANINLVNTATKGFVGPSFSGLIGVDKDKVEGVDIYAPGTFKLKINRHFEYASMPSDSYVQRVEGLTAHVNDAYLEFTYKDQLFQAQRGELLLVQTSAKDSNTKGFDISYSFVGIRNDYNIKVGDADGTEVTALANTATITTGSSTIQITDASNISRYTPGLLVVGTGIPAGAILNGAVVNLLSLVMPDGSPALCTVDGSGVPVKFFRPVLSKEGHQYIWIRTHETQQTVGTEKYKIQKPSSAHIERVYDYGNFADLQLFTTISNQQFTLETELIDEDVEEEEEDLFQGFIGFTG